jgi:hypothetical protein
MTLDQRYKVLFEPVRIGPVIAKKRFYQVPHCSGMGFNWPQTDGDYVYDGEPADVSDDADRGAFRTSITRLAALPATAVYPGHFGRGDISEMRAAITHYLAGGAAEKGPNTYADAHP